MTAPRKVEFEEMTDAGLAAQEDREGNHPFELGRQAALDGKALDANPFPRRTANALAFKNGWNSVIADKGKQAAAAADDSTNGGDAPSTNGKYKTKARYIQSDLPGTEDGKPKFDEDVDQAARAYAEARDARMAAGKVEKERKDLLIGLLQTKQLPGYKFEDVEVELVTGDVKLKVRIKDSGDEAGDE